MLNWELLYNLLTSSYKQSCELALIFVPHKGLTTRRGYNFSDHFSLKKNGKTVIFARHYRMIRVMALKVCFKISTQVFSLEVVACPNWFVQRNYDCITPQNTCESVSSHVKYTILEINHTHSNES